jgi:Xaa-Pro aminopeptidase
MVTLRNTALEYLRPGIKCCEVFQEVRGLADERGIGLVAELGIGHGIGVSTCEAPYLNSTDRTELEADMVLVLDLAVYAVGGEILRSKDTILITETGCEKLGWYLNWDELQHVIETPRDPSEIRLV